VIGHSLGGLLAQIVAGRGLSAGKRWRSTRRPSVACCHCRSLRSGHRRRSLGKTRPTANRAVPLTYEQFRYAFANAVSEDEAKELYETFAVPASGAPIFQAAASQTSTRGRRRRSTARNPDRGPLLFISGEKKNHTVPWAVTNASYKRQKAQTTA